MLFHIFDKMPSLKLTPFQAKFLAEGIGSFVFVMTISLAEAKCGNSAINGGSRTRNLAPLAIGFMLSVMVFTFGYVSGGHFNPAVTLGVLMIRKIRIELATAYWMAQILGSILGAIFALIVNGETRRLPAPQVYKNLPEFVFRGFVGEAIFTAALVTVVLHVALSAQKNDHYYGLAIGMCVLSAAYAVGGVSGGSFNPAVATSLQLVKCFTGNCIPLMHLWLYWAAPAAGAIGASLLFKLTHPAPKEEVKEQGQATVY